MIDLSAFTKSERRARPASQKSAEIGLERWNEAIANLNDRTIAGGAEALADDAASRLLLEVIFGNSPFLTQCLLNDIGTTVAWRKSGLTATFQQILDELRVSAEAAVSESALMRDLRVARRRCALVVALSDIVGLASIDATMDALSRFAAAAIETAIAFLLREAQARGKLPKSISLTPATSGYIVLAMGKLGGGELNYSSDIDLIALFEPDRLDPALVDALGDQGPGPFFVALTRDLVRILETRTADGYVFRMDLRLRPDPGVTPVAISTLAAETYYESMGQNWERAAMIKAHPIAGDRAAGEAFLAAIRPFVWRKHLDFAAIQDIHSIKRQIHAHKGGAKIAIAGHNVKLGRGGIREIEFFAQTQQLIWGGREPELRARVTTQTLTALAKHGRIAERTAEEMIEAYGFLRTVEHRLQMIDDQQTHELPKDEKGLAALAAFLGYADADAFSEALAQRLRTVERHYAALFEEAPALGGTGNLVFTGGEHDPDTLATLERIGYDDPERVSAIVRGWHHGRYRAMRSVRAREMLTEIMPALLEALAATPGPDEALLKFDEFLSAQPAGVQLFAMFHANPGQLSLVAEVMGSAPELAARLGANASLFEAIVSEGFFDALPDPAKLAEDIARTLGEARDFQDVLDLCRRWTNDHRFQVGIQYFRCMIDAGAAGRALADIADAVLSALWPPVIAEFEEQHGRFAGGGMAVLAMGKLGGREMTMTSDLDLIFLFDVPEGADQSDGDKPLTPGHYYTRLSQRYLNAITAMTAEGRLYEVDMRLRPSGNAGPLATGLAGFIAYQNEKAWTWEHMALTRARVILGPDDLRSRIEADVRAVLCKPRDPDTLVTEVAEMRERIAREHGAGNEWQVKRRRGGVVDLEFLAQYLQLRHAAEHPEVLSANTLRGFEQLAAAGCLDGATAATLIEATQFWQGLQSMLRLTVGEDFDEESATDGLRALLARAGGAEDFADLKDRIAQTSAAVYEIFKGMIDEPAAQIAANKDKQSG
ncbi:MAG TPA: bifunctional [glutamine synthetase] adenylyltransferase/[glutamine synthetase]-adenylyl-L-tyrosine phosphorylase [Alphaproteobacteria bacterium]|nr:bifunctional [glutamine synthetase] adenylyltransferase/[glutamine synthetase]-adenylyl-L-tyrosine phosphorylase [Alphaproteobacteria bacterium]